ncbi:nucleotide sugar dehydrogenase [Paraconexibacter antarcticus]|uniref:Nucleotide sugar dehydrogenase n=1 Tax=Paraconexibacter antarcticus TaxID=2949664 RepID=A0ABY5DRA3_9ACTN|nr:nucleotide sugar dehydrogenase [Paraconexibacter antarcticus]UTI64563.1 nucleotide sugar dehydrogenase [Paraconexibacter antarcticus]
MRAVVVALGKIGLPLAAQLARQGHEVIGCDIDERVVDLVNAGREPFPGEAELADVLADVVPRGLLRATTDTAAAVATGPDLLIAVPPLVVDTEARPDWSILDAVVADIARGLTTGHDARDMGEPVMTLAVETTLPVGTTRTRIAPALEAGSGLVSGSGFHLVFSPERVFSGRIFRDLATYPKLVGGLDPAGEARGVHLYEQFLPGVEVRSMGGAEAAELTKLVETTYRDVNIALANEFARHADALGLDVQRVIDAANSQPFSHVHRPGVAVGGHCIPVYPRFYLAGDPDARLPAVSRAVNESMPAYAVSLLADELPEGGRVLILGVAYRGGVKETAFSGAFGVRDELLARGMHPVAADPLYDAAELEALGFEPWLPGTPVDAAVLQADHAEYAALGPDDLPGLRVLVDGRGTVDRAPFVAAGVAVRRIGRP